MSSPGFKTAALMLGLALLPGCGDEASTVVPPENAQEATSKLIQDDVVGASLRVPNEWGLMKDEYLSEAYGFVLVQPAGASGPHSTRRCSRMPPWTARAVPTVGRA